MKSSRCISSVSELCSTLGISRTHFYELRKDQFSPEPVRLNGNGKVGYPLAAWRKFIKRERPSRPSEKSQLELEHLRKKNHLLDLEIADVTNERAEAIATEIIGSCRRVIANLRSHIFQMPDELTGAFIMLAQDNNPQKFYRRFKDEMRERFEAADKALRKIEHASKRKTNVVSIHSGEGNGSRMAS